MSRYTLVELYPKTRDVRALPRSRENRENPQNQFENACAIHKISKSVITALPDEHGRDSGVDGGENVRKRRNDRTVKLRRRGQGGGPGPQLLPHVV